MRNLIKVTVLIFILSFILDNWNTEEVKIISKVQHEKEEEGTNDDVAFFVESRKGKPILQYNGYRYRKVYKAKNGTRWACSQNKNCSAFLYINDEDEIIMVHQNHDHPSVLRYEDIDENHDDTAVVITSRKGKEMLLFRQYTYRKQYEKGDRARWVCSTLKNCRACVFTDKNNVITSVFEEHCHDPPKYYLKHDHVLKDMEKHHDV